MYARAVDDAATRLRELRHAEREDLGVAVLALALAVAASEVHRPLAVPLFLAGIAVGALGVRALWRRWDLVDRLAGEPDAHEIAEVRAYACREATMERRRGLALLIRSRLSQPGLGCEERVAAAAGELEALARDLDDGDLELDPVAAVACMRLLRDAAESALLNPALPAVDLVSRIRRIRSGFRPAGA